MPFPGDKDDFATILSRAQQLPEVAEGNGKDLPTDGFPLPVAPHHRVVDASQDPRGIEGTIAYDFTVFRDVFMIYRPWEGCRRCAEAIGNQLVTIPTDGDYSCPHTDKLRYQGIVNRCLAGELLMGSENEVVQKDGSIVVSMKWFEKKLNPRRARKSGIAPSVPGQKDEPSL